MRYGFTMLALCLTVACASPPSPAACPGEFRPINESVKQSSLDSAASIALCMRGDNRVHKG
jgi:hypothetical protein